MAVPALSKTYTSYSRQRTYSTHARTHEHIHTQLAQHHTQPSSQRLCSSPSIPHSSRLSALRAFRKPMRFCRRAFRKPMVAAAHRQPLGQIGSPDPSEPETVVFDNNKTTIHLSVGPRGKITGQKISPARNTDMASRHRTKADPTVAGSQN